jgi:PTH1 family peptidyl-tRNA hydrolase
VLEGYKGEKEVKVIVGLGNPGKKYEFTRHNIGFITLDYIADQLDISLDQSKFKGLYGEGRFKNEKVLLLKPMTYMNLSGEAIREITDFYKLTNEDILIIYDDLDLPSGKIKLRLKGGSGGHNGLKSIMAHLGTEEFKRVKMGIGRPTHGDVVSYVLGQFSKDEEQNLEDAVKKATESSLSFLEEEDFTKVMNIYNA